MLKKILTLSISLASSVLISLSAYADKLQDSKIVVVEGEAVINVSQDVAEKAAIAQALRNAVEQVSGVYIQSETKVKDFQTMSDEIYTKASGYISDNELIEKKVKNGTVVVKVKATVSLEPLVEKLKKLGLLRKWTIAVLMNSKDSSQFAETASTAINEQIIENGFRVVDRDVMSSVEQPDILEQVSKGNYLAASKLLRDNAVDVLIVGKASTINISGNNYNAYGVDVSLNSAKGIIDAKLVRTDTGEMLASKSFDSMGLGAGNDVYNQALKQSGTLAGDYFSKQIMKLPASTSSYIQLYVKGLSYSKAKDFISALKDIQNIRKVTSKGYRNKEAIYEIETDGDVSLLADSISENSNISKKYKFEILSVSSGKIEASAK